MLASKLKKEEITTFKHLVSELKLVAVNGIVPIVQEMKSTSDFSSLVSPHLTFFIFPIQVRERKGLK